MINSVLASQGSILCLFSTDVYDYGTLEAVSKFICPISCDKAVISKPVQNVVLFSFASPRPNARPVAVQLNYILFGAEVTLQLKIALLKTQERYSCQTIFSSRSFRHSAISMASELKRSKSRLVARRTTSNTKLKND